MSRYLAKPTFLDKAIGYFAPEAGLRRMHARTVLHQFGLDAAHGGHLRGGSGGQAKNASSESWRMQRDRIAVMWDARDEVRNNPIMGGIVHRCAMYVTSGLHYRANTGDEGIDKIYNDYFHDWCGGDDVEDPGHRGCDLTGRFRFIKYAELAFVQALTDGDFGTIPVRDGEEERLRIQAIEADRIGNPLEAKTSSPTYIGGLTLNGKGQVESYRVYDRTHTAQYVNPREIPRADFLHLADWNRTDQYRPYSWLQLALPTSRDIREWLACEKAAAKWAATFAAFLVGKTGYPNTGATAWDGTTAAGTPAQDAVIGKILRLTEGEDVKFAPGSSRPSGAFIAGVQTFMRFMATALDLPYGFIWDMGLLGGVAQRIEVMQAQRRIEYWKAWLAHQLLTPVKNAVLQDGIDRGEIPPAFKDRGDGMLVPSYKDGEWGWGPWLTGDVGNQTSADIQLMQAGVKPPEQLTTEYLGASFVDVVRKTTANVKTRQVEAAATGVPIELQAPSLYVNATQLLAAMNTPPAAPPEPGSLDALGEKGAKQVLELLEGVSTGRMEREAAVQTLVTVYGLTLEQAEAVVPRGVVRAEGSSGNGTDGTNGTDRTDE